MATKLIDVRCTQCGKLLGRFHGEGRIKCPRSNCGAINDFDTSQITPQHNDGHVPLKERKSSGGFTFK